MKPKVFPEVSAELLEALKRHFPDRLPRHQVSSEDVSKLQGQQSVIDFLTVKFNDQNDPQGNS